MGSGRRLIPAALGIFGHGNVAGLGQALDELSDELPFIQGRHEQYLAHIAIAYGKATRRHATLAVTASIGPGALNLVTAAGLATVNRLPVLLLPGDTYATRHQGPVLQQLEHASEADATVNDAFRPVSRFFDRITRPEQLLTALPQAMRVLTSPADTGAVVISLPQDIQSHAFDFPVEFFEPRDWKIRRPLPDPEEIAQVAALIREASRPVLIAGGGIHYSDAHAALEQFAETVGCPGGGDLRRQGRGHPRRVVAGRRRRPGRQLRLQFPCQTSRSGDQCGYPADRLRHRLAVDLRERPVRFASLNVVDADTRKQGAVGILADARLGLEALTAALGDHTTSAAWRDTVDAPPRPTGRRSAPRRWTRMSRSPGRSTPTRR